MDLDGFGTRLKTALTGAPDASLVLLGNFEVEEQWAVGEPGLPRVAFAAADAVVNRMDEFAVLLAGKDDHVVLKAAPDPDYLTYLDALGIALPTILTVEDQDPARTVSEDALHSPALLTRLAALGADGCRLVPHGVSTVEEGLARIAGLPLAAPDAATCKRVNSKVYSRRVADDLGLRQSTGWACATVAELADAIGRAADLVDAGRTMVVKDAYGVSGKGLLVASERLRLEQLLRKVQRRAERTGDDRAGLVVEEWVAKHADLNYQFTVGRDGSVRFDFVKEAITEHGVHKGHRIPARLNLAQVAQVRDAAAAIGGRLAADGFFGVVGVDALVEPDGGIFPVLEINARNNMSTYQVVLQETFVATDQVALARLYPLRLPAPLPFGRLADALDGLLLPAAGGTGLLVNNFATVNAAAGGSTDTFDGRLYGILVADDSDQLAALDAEIVNRLAVLTTGALR